MKRHIRRFAAASVLALMFVVALAQCVLGAEIHLTVTPTRGTENTVYTFTAVWTDKEAWPNIGEDGLSQDPGLLFLYGAGPGPEGYEGIPMYYVGGDLVTGAVYRVCVSGGLNMSQVKQQPNQPGLLTPDPTDPSTFFPVYGSAPNSLLWDANDAGVTGLPYPIWYAPVLRGDSPPARALWAGGIVATEDEAEDGSTTLKIDRVPSNVVYVELVRSAPLRNMVDYGFGVTVGHAGSWYDGLTHFSEDGLSGYPYGMPSLNDYDPLDVRPTLARNDTAPDDGSSSHWYRFGARYHSDAKPALPPRAWFPISNPDRRIALYLAEANTADYELYGLGAYEVEDDGQGIYAGTFTTTPGWAYCSLPIGVYHYFFGCSDDYLAFPFGRGGFVLDHQYGDEWGAGDWGGALDPIYSREVTDYAEVYRPPHRRYSDDGAIRMDSEIYVDRQIRAPGFFEIVGNEYKFKCSEHPRITIQLTVPYSDEYGVMYDDPDIYGGPRFYGTMWPAGGWKRCVNPLMPGSAVYGWHAIRAEAGGATTGDEVEFRILYRQLENKPPKYVKLFINNASTRSNVPNVSADTVGGVSTNRPASDYVYKEYAMQPDEIPATGRPYYDGVWYRFRTKLPAGPHTYYIEAADDEHLCIWPRRNDIGYGSDAWVPTDSPDPQSVAERDSTTLIYDDNDYVPGPYINTAPKLSDYSVTPTSGKMGDSFRFRVKYSDADGQRPYSAYVYIEATDGGNAIPCKMLPEVPVNGTTDNRALYKQGVYYYFDSSTMQKLSLSPGTRRYYFEFIDDWGRQVDINDKVAGEKVEVTSDGIKWKSGPTITGPIPPVLNDAKVEAADGTNNSATLWKFSVQYKDANNDAPSSIRIVIGQLQPDNMTILWDTGHAMLPADPSDKVYTDGAYYTYSTRLSGKVFEDEMAKQYFYAFLASDGTVWAEYDAATSTAASIVRVTDDASAITQISPTEFVLNPPVPGSPIVGPVQNMFTNTASELSDAQIFVGGYMDNDVDGLRQLLGGTYQYVDDEKSGWQGEERYSLMRGSASTIDHKPSRRYCVPTYPEWIGSVEGVYTSLDDLMAGVNNYYDPTLAGDEVYTMTGTIDPLDQSGASILPAEPWRIDNVIGVYLDRDMTQQIVSAVDMDNQNRIMITDTAEMMPPATATPVYIKYKRNGYWISNQTIWLTSDLPEEYGTVKQPKTLYVKYHDVRFTHQIRGQSATSTFWRPDGWLTGNLRIKSNTVDPTAGILGVWTNQNRQFANYYNPFRAGFRHPENVDRLAVTTLLPAGTLTAYAHYYQKGSYHIDRSNGKITFIAGAPAGQVRANYAFGTPMAQKIDKNTSPFLSEGKVLPISGSRTTGYVYTVIYRDVDGPNGQAPEYVRVYIDGVPFNMTPAGSGGTPAYRDGALYTYTARGLSGGSHKFRFDASDGADVVWFDKVSAQAAPGAPQSTGHRYDPDPALSTLTSELIDIDGPWVNDPPTLSNGVAIPNPAAPGTIGTGESVDYTVVYTDSDNDPPFVYNAGTDAASAANVIGTPRVWVDSGTTDESVEARATSLAADPLEPGKKRVMTIVNLNGSNPAWAVDRFAGKLLQITNGPNLNRVYLIQSNTADTLTIATDNLAEDMKDYLDISGNIREEIPMTFRINGLVMSKLNAEQQDFTQGVTYRITVPRLAVGNHKFHFTAASRVTKPAWLIGTVAPFSVEQRFPNTGDVTGPNVVSRAPNGNVKPVLTSNMVIAGPYVKKATLVTASKIQLNTGDNWSLPEAANVRRIEGVYINATLDANTDYNTTNYLRVPYAELLSPYQVDLTEAVPAVAGGTQLVQLGRPDSPSLLNVVPDSLASIQTVSGVYLNASMTAPNYYASFDGSKIALNQPLPTGTTKVYIKYALNGGATYPPVYVKYFRANPATFLSGDPITFRLSYRDDDNDPPTYHDGVQGYAKLLFTGVSVPRFMIPIATPANYLSAVPLSVTVADAPEGTSKYHFEGSDGYDPDHLVRLPETASGADDYSLKVNYKPVLTNARVEPQAGLPSSEYTFRVTYRDTDYDAAAQAPSVTVRLIKVDGGFIELPVYTMTAETGGSYATGKNFSLKIPSGSIGQLLPGQYTVAFEAYDGTQAAAPVSTPNLTVRLSNAAPTIVDHAVTPVAGRTSATFVYRAHFRDPDGDPPAVVVGDVRYEGLKLTIDKGTDKERVVVMTKASSEATYPDYAAAGGVLFETPNGVNGALLGDGAHTYQIDATDGTLAATPVNATNAPVVLVPHFDQLRIVESLEGDQSEAEAVTNAAVGQHVLIQGFLMFPKNQLTGKPADERTDASIKTSLKVTKPDGTTFTLKAKLEMLPDNTDASYWVGAISAFSYPTDGDSSLSSGKDLTLNASGQWKFSAYRIAAGNWDPAETDETLDGRNDIFKTVVGGPLRTIAVADPLLPATSTPLVDMVTPAMVIGDGNVGRVFGFDWAEQMQIVRWDALSKTYYRYGSGTFPLISPGEAVWIKPKLSYPAEEIRQVDIESGLLSSGNSGVNLDPNKEYRLIHAFSKDYPKVPGTNTLAPCVINLHTGWNQIGNIFFNWKKGANNVPVQPKQDVGIPISQLRVRYLGRELSIADAANALPTPWVRSYAWRFDPGTRQYVLVSPTATGAERVLKAWNGYWIRALVDCQLVIDPNTTYNGASLAAPTVKGVNATSTEQFDNPPAAP